MAPGWPAQTVAAAASGERMRLARQLQGRLRAALCSRCEVRRGRRVALTVHEEELHSQQAGDVGAGRGGVGTRGVPELVGVHNLLRVRQGRGGGREQLPRRLQGARGCRTLRGPGGARTCARMPATPSMAQRLCTRSDSANLRARRVRPFDIRTPVGWASKPPPPSAQRRPTHAPLTRSGARRWRRDPAGRSRSSRGASRSRGGPGSLQGCGAGGHTGATPRQASTPRAMRSCLITVAGQPDGPVGGHHGPGAIAARTQRLAGEARARGH